LISNFIFARHITPDEYGIWGFATVYASFVGIPFALSFSTAMLQLGPEHRKVFGTVRRMTLLLSLALVIPMLIVAVILDATGSTVLANCFLGTAAGQVVTAIGGVYEGALHRMMRYHFVAFVRIFSIGLSIAMTIPLALTTPGPFVLVLRDILPPLIALITVMIYLHRQHASAALGIETGFDRATARATWQLGKGLFVNRAFEIAVNRLDSLVVGLVLGKGSLGYFDQAKYIAGLPSAAIAPFSQSVALRTFSALRDDAVRLGRAFQLVQWAVARAGIVFAFGCLIAPELVIQIVYGPGWEVSAEMLRFFAIWIFAVPLISNQQIFFIAIHTFAPARWAFIVNAVVLPIGLLPALLLDEPTIAPLGNSLAYLAMLIALNHYLAKRQLSGWPNLIAPLIAFGGIGALALVARFTIFSTFAPPIAAALTLAFGLVGFGIALFALEGRAIRVELRYLKDMMRGRG